MTMSRAKTMLILPFRGTGERPLFPGKKGSTVN